MLRIRRLPQALLVARFGWQMRATPRVLFEGLEAAPATCEPGAALAWLHDRVAADRDVSVAEGGEVQLLVLHGSLVSLDAEHHYCGIALSSTLGAAR